MVGSSLRQARASVPLALSESLAAAAERRRRCRLELSCELPYGCFYKLGILFVGGLRIRALQLGAYIRARDFWKLPLPGPPKYPESWTVSQNEESLSHDFGYCTYMYISASKGLLDPDLGLNVSTVTVLADTWFVRAGFV